MNESNREDADKTPGELHEGSAPTPLIIVAVGIVVMVAIVGFGVMKAKGRIPTASHASAPGAVAAPTIPDKVIATVDGTPIYESEFTAAMESVPENMRGALATPAGKSRLLDEIIRLKLMEHEADRLGLTSRPDVKAQISLSSGNILASAAVNALLRKSAASSLEELYQKNKAEFETVKARQIVISYQGGLVPAKSGKPPSEADAKARAEAVAAKLRAGGDFASVARQESDEPSVAQTGGSIGEVSHKSLPPEIDKVLFSLPINQISDPVKSRYGYHVFQVTGREAKSFEEVKPFLEQQGENLRAREIIEGARAKAKVEYVDPSYAPPVGSPAPAAR